MRCAARFAFIAISSVVLPIRGWGQVQIPKPSDGYAITKTDASHAAPAGYEGRSDVSTQTLVGNTPATAGKRYVSHFTLGNTVKTCPQADGTVEGEGEFSIALDYTDAQASGTSTLHIDMRAIAKYKGTVGDNAMLGGPVNADIDYSYRQSGSMRGATGAIATSPPSEVAQHITIPFTAGFVARVVSRAGVAEGEWNARLGTGWSGEIFVSQVNDGGAGNTELQDWSDFESTRIRIEVRDGVGTASGYHESKHTGVSRRKALRGGSIVLLFDNSASSVGMVEGSSKATADVTFNKTSGRYSVGVNYEPFTAGTQHRSNCARERCTESDAPLYIEGILQAMGGDIDDPNHVHGTRTTVTPSVGRSGQGTATYTLMWDLARQGTTQ
jgi:hypothetical protein